MLMRVLLNILFLLLGLAILVVASAEPPKLERRGRWIKPPVVRVCVTYPGTVKDVEDGARDLSKLGADFGPVIEGPCRGLPPLGEIWLFGPVIEMPPGAGAVTVTEIHGGIITSAMISFRLGMAGGIVLKHELLHALGFAHIEEPGHILHPYMGLMGANYAGIEEVLRGR